MRKARGRRRSRRFAANFDMANKRWVLPRGRYTLRLAADAADEGQAITVNLPQRTYAVDWRPDDALGPVDTGE